MLDGNIVYHIRYVHGHDRFGLVHQRQQEYVINLDGKLAKSDRATEGNIGDYRVVVTKPKISPNIKKESETKATSRSKTKKKKQTTRETHNVNPAQTLFSPLPAAQAIRGKKRRSERHVLDEVEKDPKRFRKE